MAAAVDSEIKHKTIKCDLYPFCFLPMHQSSAREYNIIILDHEINVFSLMKDSGFFDAVCQSHTDVQSVKTFLRSS